MESPLVLPSALSPSPAPLIQANTNTITITTTTTHGAQFGDVVTIDLQLVPENGFVPEPLFDANGIITFVLGWGNYLPAVHELVLGKSVGDQVDNISVDAGWGERNPNLVARVPRNKFRRIKDLSLIKVGAILKLERGIQATVVEMTDDVIVVDANPPLAGASYSCSLTVLSIEPFPTSKLEYQEEEEEGEEEPCSINHRNDSEPSRFEIATWALGCFWGGELAFMRVPGVVGTKVGYTQGLTSNPSYEDVCTGKTNHIESIMVVFDPQVVSYSTLIQVAIDRLMLDGSNFRVRLFDNASSGNRQYQHCIFAHNESQRSLAMKELSSSKLGEVELQKASTFFDAEDYHQQYLYKGGQSAKKGAKETIRCFG